MTNMNETAGGSSASAASSTPTPHSTAAPEAWAAFSDMNAASDEMSPGGGEGKAFSELLPEELKKD